MQNKEMTRDRWLVDAIEESNTEIQEDISYLEGPWPELPTKLLEDIGAHFSGGGWEDFSSRLWKHPASLIHVPPDKSVRFELQGSPGRELPMGRFLYQQGWQIIIAGLPASDPQGSLDIVIVHHQRAGRKVDTDGSYRFVWGVWQPISRRSSQDRELRKIVRICYPVATDTPKPAPSQPENKKRKSPFELQTSSREKKTLVLKLRVQPHKLAMIPVAQGKIPYGAVRNGYTRKHTIEDDDDALPAAGAHPSSTSIPSSDSPPTIPTISSILPDPSEGVETDEAIIRVPEIERHTTRVVAGVITAQPRMVDSSSVTVNMRETQSNTSSEIMQNSSRADSDEIISVIQEQASRLVHRSSRIATAAGTTRGQSRNTRTSQRKPAPKPIRVKPEDVIVIDDDDDVPPVKVEDPQSIDQHTRVIFIPPPIYPVAATYPHASDVFSPTTVTESISPSEQIHADNFSTLEDTYRNVSVEFLNTLGTIRDQKPFRRCNSARELFDAAIEAEIVEPTTRMFVIQIGERRTMRMRAQDQESFREKLLGPLNEVIGQNDGVRVIMKVRGLVYV